MQLPSNIEDLFTQQWEGFPAVKLGSAAETIMVENALTKRRLSYRTLITRSKKHGRKFIVLLMGEAPCPT